MTSSVLPTTPTISSSFLNTYIPITQWLPKYNWKSQFTTDLSAGIALLAVAIPQNMAYASLAGLPPFYGLYTCLVPALVYIIFGSGKFTAVGTFSLIAIMVKQSSDIIASQLSKLDSETNTIGSEFMSIVFVLTFFIGLVQLILGISGIGKPITNYLLPDASIKGFVCASSLTILTTQLTPGLGMTVPKFDGLILQVFRKWWYVLTHVYLVHWPTALLTILALILIPLVQQFNGYLNAQTEETIPLLPSTSSNQISRKFNIQFPDILTVMAIATIVVGYFRLDILAQLAIVGTIPSGLPTYLPLDTTLFFDLSKLTLFIFPSILIALTSYVITIAASKAYPPATQPIKEDQELIALGLSSLLGCFFQSYANCGSLTRTAVLVRSGATSQISQLCTTFLLALTLLYLTPVFYFLPKALLAAVVVTACKSLLLDVLKLPTRFSNFVDNQTAEESRLDFSIWVAMFSSTLILDLQNGLILGIIITMMLRVFVPFINN